MRIQVCIGSACHLKGSYVVIQKLKQLIEEYHLEKEVTLQSSFCLGTCTKAVSVKVDNEEITSVSPDSIDEFFKNAVLGVINNDAIY